MEPTRTKTFALPLVVLLAAAIAGAAITLLILANSNDQAVAADSDSADSDSGNPTAPDFTVTLFDGTEFNLRNHQETDGRPVVLNLWASWCAPCRAEMPDFEQFQAENPGILILGVAVSDIEADSRALADELGITYALAFDASETVAAAYPPLGMPATFFLSEAGTVERQVFGQISLQQLREHTAGAFGF